MTFKKIRAAGDDDRQITSRELLDTLGRETFDKLRECFGGSEIKPPKHPADDHPIVIALGREEAEFFCEEFGGIRLYVPKAGDCFEARDEFIRRAIGNGIRRTEIARSLDISERQLRRIVARLGLSITVMRSTGKTPVEVAASVRTGVPDTVNFEHGVVNCVSGFTRSSVHGSARRKRILTIAEKTDRRITNSSAAVVRQWERLIRRNLERRISRVDAAKMLGVNYEEFNRLRTRFLETGTIVPTAMPAVPPHSNSNAGLTALASISAISAHPTPETRVSGP